MAAVQAYVYFRRFGILPRAGGTFDQPGDLMDELSFVAGEVDAYDRRKREADDRRTERRARRRPRGKGR